MMKNRKKRFGWKMRALATLLCFALALTSVKWSGVWDTIVYAKKKKNKNKATNKQSLEQQFKAAIKNGKISKDLYNKYVKEMDKKPAKVTFYVALKDDDGNECGIKKTITETSWTKLMDKKCGINDIGIGFNKDEKDKWNNLLTFEDHWTWYVEDCVTGKKGAKSFPKWKTDKSGNLVKTKQSITFEKHIEQRGFPLSESFYFGSQNNKNEGKDNTIDPQFAGRGTIRMFDKAIPDALTLDERTHANLFLAATKIDVPIHVHYVYKKKNGKYAMSFS